RRRSAPASIANRGRLVVSKAFYVVCRACVRVVETDAMNDTLQEPDDFTSLYRRAFAEYGDTGALEYAAYRRPYARRCLGDHEGPADAWRHGWAAFGRTD